MDNLTDKNPRCGLGFTSFHLAAKEGHLEVCRLFLENIVDKNPVSDNGRVYVWRKKITPYDWA